MRPRLVCTFALLAALPTALRAESLPGTRPLEMKGDLATQMVAGIDKYLMRELEASRAERLKRWKLDTSSRDAYLKALQARRDRLKQILGVVDQRLPVKELQYV